MSIDRISSMYVLTKPTVSRLLLAYYIGYTETLTQSMKTVSTLIFFPNRLAYVSEFRGSNLKNPSCSFLDFVVPN